MVARARKMVQPAPIEIEEDVVDSGEVQLGFLADSIGFHLRLAQDAANRSFARHADTDLMKPGRFPALAIIHLNPGISQSALGRAIARDKSTVSPLIKDLQNSGYIARKASLLDRRSVTLTLTKKGERVLGKLVTRANVHEEELDRIAGGSKGTSDHPARQDYGGRRLASPRGQPPFLRAGRDASPRRLRLRCASAQPRRFADLRRNGPIRLDAPTLVLFQSLAGRFAPCYHLRRSLRGGIGRRNRLKRSGMSAPVETPGVELLKFGESFTADPEPSPRSGKV